MIINNTRLVVVVTLDVQRREERRLQNVTASTILTGTHTPKNKTNEQQQQRQKSWTQQCGATFNCMLYRPNDWNAQRDIKVHLDDFSGNETKLLFPLCPHSNGRYTFGSQKACFCHRDLVVERPYYSLFCFVIILLEKTYFNYIT